MAVLEDRRTLHAPADAARLPRDLDALLGHLPPHRRHGPAGCVPVLGLAVHSGAVRPGSLFACVPGTRDDGHRWAAAAVRAGASALLVERPLPELAGVPQVEVADVRAALAAAARAFHGYADRRLQVLAVTGTNGKTTTACMLESALAAARRPAALLGTVSYRVGRREVASPLTTPDAAALHAMLREAADEGAAAVVMEASSHALAQRRLEGIEVDTAIFTNLSRDHLDYHGSLMAYFAAKRRLFAPRGGAKPYPALAVVCTDGAAGRLIARETRAHRRVITYGLLAPAEVRGQYRVRGDAALLAVQGPWGRGELRLPLPGRHNAQNALGALSAALANGVPFDTAAHAIRTLRTVPGRFEAIDAGQDFAVIVDFAHNPHGLLQALRTARRRCAGTLRLVFGCKGRDQDGYKRRRMGEIAARLADEVILTTDDPYDEDPARIAAEVGEGLQGAPARHRVVLDRRSAIREAILEAGPRDLVLVAGRGHERFQATAGGLVPCDDREVCREVLAERLGRDRGQRQRPMTLAAPAGD